MLKKSMEIMQRRREEIEGYNGRGDKDGDNWRGEEREGASEEMKGERGI